MITLSNPIQIIKQFNPAYSYPMDYVIYNTYDTDPNTLNDYGQVISFRSIRNESTAPVLTFIFYLTDSLIPQEETISRTTTSKTFWFTNRVKRFCLVYKGLTADNINKIVELEYSYGNNTLSAPYPSGISFAKYHTGIKKCSILKEAINTSGTATIKLFVVDRLCVTHCYTGNISSAIGTTIINNWGELNVQSTCAIRDLPTNTLTELWLTKAIGILPLTDVYTDRWFPSYNGCFPLYINSGGTKSIDDKENLETGNSIDVYGYEPLYLRHLIDDNLGNDNKPRVSSQLTVTIANRINEKKKVGLIISASTIPVDSICKCVTINGTVCYHCFPDWLYTAVLNLGQNIGFYISNRNNGSGGTSNFCFLNWANSTVRGYFIDCINAIKDYLDSDPNYWKFIDFIKVGFIGTWGEGYTLSNPPSSCVPTSENLLEIQNAIYTAFQNRVCLAGFRSYLNGELPELYRNSMIAEGKGMFNDSVNNISRIWYNGGFNNNIDHTLDDAFPEKMNNGFQHSKTHLTYIECEPHLSGPELSPSKPYYADLEAHAQYYSPDLFSLHNIFDSGNGLTPDNSPDIFNVMRKLSRYVGTRPFLIVNTVTLTAQSLYVNIKIGNFGTAQIRSYWKLRFYIESPNGNIINENNPIESGLDLQTVPKAFEPGVPNRYDTVNLSMTYTNSYGVSAANGYKVLAALEDGDGVYQKRLMFCNDLSLPRELTNGTPTGRVYLI